jgi:hypothetical protein
MMLVKSYNLQLRRQILYLYFMISLKREVLSLVRLLHISQLLAEVQCYHLTRTHRLHMRYHDQ